MSDLQVQFNNWLNKELRIAGGIAKAFCINVYEEDERDIYSFDLAGFGYYNEYNDDWACEREEMYASRDNGELMLTEVYGGREACLATVKSLIQNYLNSDVCLNCFKNALAVAYGFVDGNLYVACKSEK